MKRLQRLISIARADFRQRFRNRTLLAVPVLIAYLGHLITGEGVTFVIGSYTGAATAAWFAGVTALAGTALLVIFGFYLVTGTIERDRRTGVGALVATTPIRDSTYVFGKWLSHVALLAVLVGTLALATLGTFLLRGSGPLALWPVVSPFLLVTLPAMTLVGAVAVLFETIRPLRATAGKVAYFVLAMTAFAMASAGILPGAMDPFGFGLIRESMVSSVVAQTPETTSPQTFAFTNMEATAGTFRWPGITWTFWQVGERLTLVVLATILVTAAGMAFDRFAPVTAETSDTADRSDRSPTMDTPSVDVPSPATPGPAAAILSVSPRLPTALRHGWFQLLLGELRLSLRGRHRWWYAGAGILIVAGAIVDANTATEAILPLAWLLPLPIWADLGVRERRDRTAPLVFTSRWPLGQLGFAWLTGLLVALLLGGGVGVRLLVAGAGTSLLSLLIGVAFVPSLAVGLGSLTGTTRAFEAAYLFLWYVGPIEGARPFDFTATVGTGYWLVYVAGTFALMGIGFGIRQRFLRR